MRKRYFLIIGILLLMFTFIYNFSFTVKAYSPPSTQSSYSINSSFIQYWYCMNFDYDRWKDEFIALKALGIEELIIQTTVDTKTKYAIYPTKISGFTSNVNDSIACALAAANDTGMKVRLGLGESSDWWKKLGFNNNWLTKEKLLNIEIANELIQNYGHYDSLSGWYIPYELYQFSAITKKHRTYLNTFYKDISQNIRNKSDLNIMISPFFKSNLSFAMSLDKWTSMLKDIYFDTAIDILALQDSIGAGFNTLNNIDNVFLHTKLATDELGIKLYGNVETFIKKDDKFLSQDEAHISMQIEKIMPYVDGLISFSASHYQINR